jgi:glutamate 5-kinase
MTGNETALSAAKRLVVKIGSALLVDAESGRLRRDWLSALGQDLTALRGNGVETVVVSSGAIALGRERLDRTRKPVRLEEKQATAAVGQIALAHAWEETLAPHGITVAQILLTLSDTEERRRHLNARSTLNTLLRFGVVPVINENDTVATDEIRFGDNDRLAARVAQMISADTLVLLSDVDGLYTRDPRLDPTATRIPVVREITADIAAMATPPLPGYSAGGMVTKLAAGRIALSAGCRMAIANGRKMHPLRSLAESGSCTWFLPTATPRTARKKWITAAIDPAGSITVDDGAAAALRGGKSLLPAGVVAVDGNFERGDAVVVRGAQGVLLGKGLCAYSAADARRLIGCKTADIERVLGYRGRDEMIHRDDLVLDL